MKLKNSYILLIAISLFLLISIGSVCAADNTNADDVIQASDSTADIDLTNTEDTVLGEDLSTAQEKINTTVESEDVKVSENDPVEIPVSVKDNESAHIEIVKDNITIKEGNKTINFNYNNTLVSIVDKLAVGKHSFIINYLGNDVYKNSTKNITVSIFGNKTLKVPSVVGTDGKTINIPINLTDGVDEYAINKDNLTLNLTYVDKNGNSSSQIINSFVIENNALKFAVDNLKFVSANVNLNYTETKESKNVVIKYATEISANNMTFREKEDQNITVIVVSGDEILNIAEKDLKVTEKGKELKFKYTNDTVKITDALARGIHNVVITYVGNNTYNEASKNILISVYGNLTIEANVSSLDINSTRKGAIKVNVTNGVNNTPFTKEDISLNATTKVGNNTTVINVKNFEIVNGAIVFELENGDFTTADLTITYKNEISKSITLNRIFNVIVEPTNTKNEYQNGAFTFKFTDIDDGTTSLEGKELSLTTIGNIMAGFSAKVDKNNTASFKTANLYEFDNTNSSLTMIPFYVGNHAVNIKTTGNVKSTPINNLNLTVTQANIKIVISPFKEEYGTDKNVTITVTNKNNGEAVPGIVLHLNMPQTSDKDYYFQTDSNGQSKVSVKQLVGGTYDITVSNNDTANIASAKTSSQIIIVPKPVVISKIGSNTIWYNSGYSAVFKITDKKTGKTVPGVFVVIQIDGNVNKTYITQASNKGYVTIQADMTVGKHTITIQTADTRYNGTVVTKKIKVIKDTAKIKAPKVTAYYNGGKYLTMTLLNAKNNKPIYYAKIAFRIVTSTGYSTYSGTTGSNGQLRLSLDGIAPGTYKVLVYGNDAKNYAAKKVSSKFTIVKAPTKIYAPKLTAKKGDNKYFKVTVKNSKTKTPIAKVKVKIKIKVGNTYKTYTLKTNAKGIAYLSTAKFKVGTYKVTVQSANAYCVAKAVASSIKITK